MKLGFTTFDNLKALPFAKEAGFQCMEFTSLWDWEGAPNLVADLDTDAKVSEFRGAVEASGIPVGSIIGVFNPMAAEPDVAAAHQDYFKKLIVLAGKLGIPYVSSTSGQNPTISLDENVRLFGKVYRELVKVAEDSGVKIVFENCLHGYPAGQNIAVNPQTWEKVFNEVQSDTLGIEFDPSHLMFQFIDPVAAAKEFASKIFIVHAKDTEVMYDKLDRGGILSLDGYWRYRLPGYGDVDWPALFQTLRENGYDGNVIIEHEDPVFGGERAQEGLIIGKQFLSQFVW